MTTGWTPPGPGPEPERGSPEPGAGDGWRPVPLGRAGFPSAPAPPFVGDPDTRLAGWALGLSLVPCCGITQVVSVAFAIVTLVRCGDGRNHGRKRAVAALAVSTASVVLFITLAALGVFEDADDSDRDSAALPRRSSDTTRGDVATSDLRQGDCLRDVISPGIRPTVALVPCTEAHYAEVYAYFDLEVAAWPGMARVERLASGGCLKRVPTFSRSVRKRAQPKVFYYAPSRLGFASDPSVSCLVSFTGKQRTLLTGPR